MQVCSHLTLDPSQPVGLVEGLGVDDDKVAIAGTLCMVNSKERVPVRLMNPTGEPLELNAGKIVGVYQPVEGEQIWDSLLPTEA